MYRNPFTKLRSEDFEKPAVDLQLKGVILSECFFRYCISKGNLYNSQMINELVL